MGDGREVRWEREEGREKSQRRGEEREEGGRGEMRQRQTGEENIFDIAEITRNEKDIPPGEENRRE